MRAKSMMRRQVKLASSNANETPGAAVLDSEDDEDVRHQSLLYRASLQLWRNLSSLSRCAPSLSMMGRHLSTRREYWEASSDSTQAEDISANAAATDVEVEV